MRKIKISILLMAAFLFSGVAFAGYSDPTFPAKKVNNEQWNQKEPYREIMLVRYSANGANAPTINSGDACVIDTVSDDGTSIGLTTTSADGAFIGIACTAIQSSDSGTTTRFDQDAGRRNYGYVVTYGRADANVTAGGTNGNAVGAAVITSTDSGKVTTFAGDTAALSGNTSISSNDSAKVARAGNRAFFLNAADGTSTVVPVFVKAQ